MQGIGKMKIDFYMHELFIFITTFIILKLRYET
jgi:hypothetical protein